jgi:hypothetical protein
MIGEYIMAFITISKDEADGLIRQALNLPTNIQIRIDTENKEQTTQQSLGEWIYVSEYWTYSFPPKEAKQFYKIQVMMTDGVIVCTDFGPPNKWLSAWCQDGDPIAMRITKFRSYDA